MIAWLLLRPRIIAGLVLLALVLAMGATVSHYRAKCDRLERDLKVSEVARAVSITLWKSEIQRLTDGLAKAKDNADKALADKAQAETAAAKKLASERKKWERIYGSKPENRAWADAELPDDVAARLRVNP